MRGLIREGHRRSLWQVLGIYLAGSWIALQVVNEIGDAVGLPQWVSAGALVLLVVGLPIIVATTLIQHSAGKAAGIRREAAAESETGSPSSAAEDGPTGQRPISAAGPRHHRLFTWRNALLGGSVAFALFGLGTGVWMGLRAAGIGPAGTLLARGALEEAALVVLADFEAEDPALADAATEALRVDLAQSEVIRLADPGLVGEALERMGRDPSGSLPVEVATEVAVREGGGAVVSGEINRAGAGYVFSVRLVAVEDGAVLTSQRESASGDEDVVPAIDRLSERLRERIGESYRSIRADRPLERVTTSSLEALELYSRALRSGTANRIALLERAVDLDSTFAMAWRALGVRYRNANVERAKAIRAFTRAFEERDRLTPLERHQAASLYYTIVDFDPRLAIVEYEAILDMDPDNLGATVNLGVLSSSVGDHERSSRYALEAMEIDPTDRNPYWNGVTSLVNTGRLDEAEALADSADRAFDRRNVRMHLMVDQARGPLAEAEAAFRASFPDDIPSMFRARLGRSFAAFAAAQGRIEEAEAETRLHAAQMLEDDEPVEYIETEIQAAWTDLAARGRPDLAVARLDTALDRAPLAKLDPLDRPYLELAEVLARAGEPARARTLVEEMRDEAEGSLSSVRQQLRQVEGEIALAEGRAEEAIEHLEASFERFCHICPLPGLALAYEASGQIEAALDAHRRYAETPYSDRFLPYTYRQGQLLGPTYERLGELYEGQGDLENAARFYAAFVELWENADAELQPRVRAAQSRLEEILAERG